VLVHVTGLNCGVTECERSVLHFAICQFGREDLPGMQSATTVHPCVAKARKGEQGVRKPCAEKDERVVVKANGTSPLEVPQVNPRTDEVT
jgi:hypothetical protein